MLRNPWRQPWDLAGRLTFTQASLGRSGCFRTGTHVLLCVEMHRFQSLCVSGLPYHTHTPRARVTHTGHTWQSARMHVYHICHMHTPSRTQQITYTCIRITTLVYTHTHAHDRSLSHSHTHTPCAYMCTSHTRGPYSWTHTHTQTCFL